MRFTKLLWLAEISATLSLVLASCIGVPAAEPHYGGTLHVKLRAASVSLDPREWAPGSSAALENERVASLVYDRLVSVDDYGRFVPGLAVEWSHDTGQRNWQFKLRTGVKFSNGTPFTAADAASSLRATLGIGYEIVATETALTIRTARPTPDLLEQLASGRNFIFRIQTDGTLLGTGPFFVAESAPAAPSEANPAAMKAGKIRLQASEASWAGRPFVDEVEITLGETPLRQLFDLQVGKAEIAEISPDLVRRAKQEGLTVWNSSPMTLIGLRFADSLAAPAADALREAICSAIDRNTMANVLLQREAQPAAALLPQWLSGYAFIFENPTNVARAKDLRAGMAGGGPGVTQPLRLRVDEQGDLLKLMGERVAVNARQASLVVQPMTAAEMHAGSVGQAAPDLRLVAWHYESLSARAELESMARHWELTENSELPPNATDPEQLYAQERKMLEERRFLPLVALPEYVGVRGNVRNWNPSAWGEWRLADVWIEGEEAVPATEEGGRQEHSAKKSPGARQ